MVITKTPFRMSFFGGGTDFKEYYKEYGTDDNVIAQKLRFFEQRDSLLNAYNLNNVKKVIQFIKNKYFKFK